MARRAEEQAKEKSVDPRAMERRRAEEYLDLWERHVTTMAIKGKCPVPPAMDPED